MLLRNVCSGMSLSLPVRVLQMRQVVLPGRFRVFPMLRCLQRT